MKCPACENTFTPVTIEAITVDVCKGGCGGLWFDRFELGKLKELRVSAGESLLEINRRTAASIDPGKKLRCPKCALPMLQHFHSVEKKAIVDQWPKCGGMWLDTGELAAIQQEHSTQESRNRAADDYFEGLFGDQLKELRTNSQQDSERARQIATAFRFICPSYYLPGKQWWGAF